MQEKLKNFKDRKTIGIILGAFLLILAAYGYWQHNKKFPDTENAYVHSDVIQISPIVTGKVTQTYVKDFQHVKKNQLILEMESEPFLITYRQRLAELQVTQQKIQALEAQIASAKANLTHSRSILVQAQRNLDRATYLFKEKATAKVDLDDRTTALEVAKAEVNANLNQLYALQKELGTPGTRNAQLQAAQAAADQAKFELDNAKIYAPSDGQLVDFTVRQGASLVARQPAFYLTETNPWWVIANFKETNLGRIKPGQSVKIRLDIYPNHTYEGIIDEISTTSGSLLSLLPPENATGNWIKITQRFPVRIKIQNNDAKYPLRSGASCWVEVDTTQ